MKKVIAFILALLMVTSFTACENESSDTVESLSEETTSEERVYVTPTPVASNEDTRENHYYYYAVEGCSIVSQDIEAGRVIYQCKCEKCGYVKPGQVSKYGLGVNSSFVCPDCGERQQITIECDVKYE